jgi:hypothetical protein
MVHERRGRSKNCEILYQVSVFVDGIITGSNMRVRVGYPLYDAPPVGEKDISPALGDPNATCEVAALEIRGNDVQDLWYM